MPVIKPGTDTERDESLPSVFLAGSIEIGVAEEWQKRVGAQIGHLYNVYDPRRDDWDSSWTEDSPELEAQILWEQHYLRRVEYILFYFDPNTKSPVTLLELGQALERDVFLAVVCPQGYFRRKNLEITCQEYGVELREDLGEVIEEIIQAG